jgi:predicted  nucleic acid-binding Zn-ribbon protein
MQVKERNKTVQDLKAEIEAINKTQTEEIQEMKNLGKRTQATDANITNKIHETKEQISGSEDTIEEIDTSVKENVKFKAFLSQNIQELWDTMKKT